MLAVGTWSLIMCTLAYIAGVSMRQLAPGLLPDKAFLRVIVTMFPPGLRGLLITGLIASLLSAVNGLLMASSTLATKDIYSKMVATSARADLKKVARGFQVAVIAVVVMLLPVAGRSRSITAFIQHFMGDVFGVIIAWYLTGVFSRRAAPRAAFFGAASGTALAVSLDVFTPLNFAYVGFLSCVATVVITLLLSRWEAPPHDGKLRNLTVWARDRGPEADPPSSWHGVWTWAGGSLVIYIALTLGWEWFLRR
jgi:Na+/proline symporter